MDAAYREHAEGAETALPRVILRKRAAAIWTVMKAEMKIGISLKPKKKKKSKRILARKRGGVLSILPLLGIFGSLVDGAAEVAETIMSVLR